MKKLIPVLLLFVASGVASAATVTIGDVPGPAIANLLIQCEELRKSLRISPADWASGVDPQSNCAKEFLRMGSRQFTRETALSAHRAAATVLVDTDMAAYDADFPKPVSAFCGDGATDVFDGLNEQCDDGNQVATDACTDDCENAVCGDGIIWAGVEQCDDGNTDSGDGCDATCNIE